MDNKIKYILPVILPIMIFLYSCGDADLTGIFVTYESADERFKQSSHDSIIELQSSSEYYEIFSMGDSHVGGTNNLDVFFDSALKAKPIATVMVGDVASGKKEDFDTLVQHIPDSDSLRTFKIVGNHDLFFEGWDTYYSYFGTSTYIFSVQTPTAKDLYFCLDTGGGTLGELQLEWFRKKLKELRSSYRHCIMFTHDNLIRLRPTTSTNPNKEEVQILLDLFIEYDINMVVTAHDHEQNVDKFGNTTIIIMDALTDTYSNAGYLKIKISETDPTYELIRLNKTE